MSETVERVARALSDGGHLGVSLAFTEPMASDTETIRKCRVVDTERALRAARAAIEALRIPSEAMVEAGQKTNNLLKEPDPPNAFEFLSRDEMTEAWEAMIDQALKD